MLDEVRTWYQVARIALALLYRNIRCDPASLPPKFASFAPFTVRKYALEYIERAQRELADLAILAYFAAFEQQLLDHFESITITLVQSESDPFKKRILEGQNQLRRPRETPLIAILDYYKAIVKPDLVGQVKQIYQYRNWVAHGKKGPIPINVTPATAYERLQAFLGSLP